MTRAVRLRRATPADRPRLLVVWRGAVEATHGFLAARDLAAIARQVEADYLPGADLLVAVDEGDAPVGFLGATGPHIDALFVDPAWHGRGVGRLLVERMGARHPVLTVDVNEQNAGGLRFYERLGFRVRGRSPRDDAGRPYPLLHMVRCAQADDRET